MAAECLGIGTESERCQEPAFLLHTTEHLGLDLKAGHAKGSRYANLGRMPRFYDPSEADDASPRSNALLQEAAMHIRAWSRKPCLAFKPVR